MSGFDIETVNQLMIQLDDGGYLFPQFELSKNENKLIFLGHGGFSHVFEMFNKERPDLKFALKIIGFERHTISSGEFWNTDKIQWILSQDSKYVVRILDAKELRVDLDENGKMLAVEDVIKEQWEEDEENGLHLQFVLMEKLDKVIAKDRFKKISLIREELSDEKEILKLALEIGQALNTAHSYSVLHRDIKLENIFWDGNEKVYKLGDFGIAKYAEDGNAETIVYTDGYGAPEIERQLYDYYNITADIYSFGITLYLLFNDLKFPGSEGYYPKVEVQYNPDFIFPAPAHASEEITKVIRKMCSFKSEDRYQCMADVLSDLVVHGEPDRTELTDDIMEMATETYRENKSDDEETETEERPKTRVERKEEQEIIEQLYREESAKFGVLISIILFFLFRGMHNEIESLSNWLFMALPAALFLEAIFQSIKEFHLFFGALIIGMNVLSALQIGITMPHIIMCACVLIGCPALTVSGAVATGSWMGLMFSGKMSWLAFLWKYDLGWILLILLLLVLNRYLYMRIEWEKTTDIGAYLGLLIYDKGFLVMIAAGIVLFVLQKMQLISISELVNRMHFIRTGIISFTVIRILSWWEDYLDEDRELSQNETGDKIVEDVDNLD